MSKPDNTVRNLTIVAGANIFPILFVGAVSFAQINADSKSCASVDGEYIDRECILNGKVVDPTSVDGMFEIIRQDAADASRERRLKEKEERDFLEACYAVEGQVRPYSDVYPSRDACFFGDEYISFTDAEDLHALVAQREG